MNWRTGGALQESPEKEDPPSPPTKLENKVSTCYIYMTQATCLLDDTAIYDKLIYVQSGNGAILRCVALCLTLICMLAV